MSNDNEWGPWVQHDGSGCPCVGQMVEVDRDRLGIYGPIIAGSEAIKMIGSPNVPGSAWVWVAVPGFNPSWIRRFRIRRPKGMAILNAILADLPAPVKTDGVIA